MFIDAYEEYRRRYSDKTTTRTILAADDSTAHADVITPKSASHRIYVQRIMVRPTTHADQDMLFRDGAGTPVSIARWYDEATAGSARPNDVPSVLFDAGPKGFPLTIGEELDIILSAAGIAASVTIEAYEKLDATISYLAGASSQ